MKSLIRVLLAGLTFCGVVACKEHCPQPENPLHPKGEVSFKTNIEVLANRVVGNKWENADAIGVYALQAGQTLPSGLYNNFGNVKYTTPGDGSFTAASTPIVFPETAALDFVAYYPYSESASNNQLPLDLSKGAVDYLYSNDAKGKTASQPVVSMTFRHVLSKLTLTVRNSSALTGLKATLSGLKTDGTLNLATGEITLGEKSENVAVTPQVNGTEATISAMLLPNQDLHEATLTFTLGDKQYAWKPEAQALQGNKNYEYTLALNADGSVAVLNLSGAVIKDWEAGNTPGSTIVLTPVGEGGTDTGNPGGGSETPTPETPEKPETPENPTPAAGKLLAPGCDFEDFSQFQSSISSEFPIKFAEHAPKKGRNGGGALHITANPTDSRNGYVFTLLSQGESLAGKKAISFYLKGTTSVRSLSIILSADDNGRSIVAYNLGSLTTDSTISPVATEYKASNAAGSSYGGDINTGDKWVKVTLDISAVAAGANANKGGTLLAFKYGKKGNYDLYVDDITIE